MTYLPSLIKKIDDFYSLAQSLTRLKKMAAGPETYSMPDDPEEESSGDEFTGIYPKAMQILKEIAATDNYNEIISDLYAVIEMYKRAIEINGGYAELIKRINVTGAECAASIDEADGEDGEDVKDLMYEILEELISDLRKRSKSTIAPQVDDATAAKELKAVRDSINTAQAGHEMGSQEQVFEKGPKGKETGHNLTVRTAETPDKYKKEIKRLQETLINEKNPQTRNNIEYLIGTIESLLETMSLVKQLKSDVSVAPDDAATVKAFEEATANLSRLRKQRRSYRRKLSDAILKDHQLQLRKKMYETRNPKEKEWLEQQVSLLDLRMDEKLLRKRHMIKALKDKLNSTGTLDEDGDFVALTMTDEQRQALDAAFQAGREKTITKTDYDRKQTIERGVGHGKRGPVPERQKGRIGGGRAGERIHNYELDKATFPGLVDKFGEKVNTSAHVARLNITQVVDGKKKFHNELKPFVDAVAKAIQKKDNAAKLAAIKTLKEQMKIRIDKAPAIKAMARNIRWLPFFQRMRSDLETVVGWQDKEVWDLNEPKVSFIQNLLRGGRKITDSYRKFYPETGPKRVNQLEISFDGTVKYLDDVLDQLSKRTGVTE